MVTLRRPNLTVRALLLLLVACSMACKSNEVPPRQATTVTTASEQMVGNWKLVSIRSGWTGKTTEADQKLKLTVNDQQQAILYSDDRREVARFDISLSEVNGNLIRYDLINAPNYIYLFSKSGVLRVSSKELIFDSTASDGPAYNFVKE